jgi:hypothetical protein
MSKQRKTYSVKLKARIGLEAIKWQQPIKEIAGQCGVYTILHEDRELRNRVYWG